MRTLPKNKTQRHKNIIQATRDYFGSGIDNVRANQIALFLMGRRKGVVLTEEEESDARAIKQNLTDKSYIESFTGEPA